MRDLDELQGDPVEAIIHAWAMFQEKAKKCEKVIERLHLHRGTAYKNPTYQKAEREKLEWATRCRVYEESGAVPWIEIRGMGNKMDDHEPPTIWASRVFDGYVAREANEGRYAGIVDPELDGRAIRLNVNSHGSVYQLNFFRPEAIQEIINQLQYELDRWDEDWDGEPAPNYALVAKARREQADE